MNCSDCANSEPKELKRPEPLYRVGQTVRWSGMLYGKSHPQQKVEIKDTLFLGNEDVVKKRWCYCVMAGNVELIIDEPELSPLPYEPKSAHKAGEVFGKDWEYAGEIKNKIQNGKAFVNKYGHFEIVVNRAEGTPLEPDEIPNNGYREILRPRKKEPRTTVHVWDKDGKEGEYSFKGEPDIDRIYEETIGEGQLVSWVRNSDGIYYVFSTDDFRDKVTLLSFWKFTCAEEVWKGCKVRQKLDQAVKDYVAKRKGDLGTVDITQTTIHPDKWTRQVGDLRVRAYENDGGNIFFKWSDGIQRDKIETICKFLNILVMPYIESKGKFEYPK